ncbi:universal stress protein [Synechococcus sp. PCC 6717]|uniref:Universal stress protein UspA n=1 Tax=Parathermosynechococcus lividus PCC 6715 TaxID=1917166 RepID=A0A2D2Q1P0_PARLV|nr:universal stress protein [Thermostichus lividus]ATS18423.1 universal stress protein UspA [Thermostichus lividus PCC 6715]MCI3281684.1 universal stress protein [Synechococcus sp. PCC 6717]
MIENILLADSGTGQSEQMLKSLMELPAIQRAAVTVLHVIPPKITAEDMAEQRQAGAKLLAEAVARLHLDPVISVNTLLREGDPKDTVLQVADEINADLIIMGSRGLKRLQSILANSVSQYVFQLSSRPMLLVRDDLFVKKINRIMVALNAQPAAKASLELAVRLMDGLKGGKLIVAHVNPDLKGHSDIQTGSAETDPVLAEAARLAKQRGIDCQCVLATGKPAEEICRIAADTNADLLVLGSPDRRPSIARSLPDLDRLLGTSLSDYVRVYAECPVLFVRQSEA